MNGRASHGYSYRCQEATIKQMERPTYISRDDLGLIESWRSTAEPRRANGSGRFNAGGRRVGSVLGYMLLSTPLKIITH